MAEELNQNMEAQAVSEAGAPAEGAAEVQVKQRGQDGSSDSVRDSVCACHFQ